MLIPYLVEPINPVLYNAVVIVGWVPCAKPVKSLVEIRCNGVKVNFVTLCVLDVFRWRIQRVHDLGEKPHQDVTGGSGGNQI
jgi:hypothetical protein